MTAATPEYVERRVTEAGVPLGGTTDQVLAKASDVDRDTQWVPVTPAAGSITTAMLADDAVTPAKVQQGTAGQLLMTNATPDTAWATLSGDATLSSAGALTIANNAVTTAKIGNDQVTAAKIQQGTAGQLLITNATPDTAWVTVTGDVTISSTGVTSIAAGVITTADLSTATGQPAGVWNSDTVNTGFTNVTSGNVSRRWRIIGKTMYFRLWFTAGTATAGGSVAVPLPGSASMQTARATFYNGVNSTTIVSAYTLIASPTLVTITNSTAGGAFTGGASLTSVTVNGTLEIS